jgi:hypothetical protein
VEWFVTEHFKQPPPIGTRVQVVSTVHQPMKEEVLKQASSPTLDVTDQLIGEDSLFAGTVLQHVKEPKTKNVQSMPRSRYYMYKY